MVMAVLVVALVGMLVVVVTVFMWLAFKNVNMATQKAYLFYVTG